MDVRHVTTTERWIRSSACGPQHNCVELHRSGTEVIIRDSKSEVATLAFDLECWAIFVGGYRD